MQLAPGFIQPRNISSCLDPWRYARKPQAQEFTGMMIPKINHGPRERKNDFLGTRPLIKDSKRMQTRLVCQYDDLLASFPCQDGWYICSNRPITVIIVRWIKVVWRLYILDNVHGGCFPFNPKFWKFQLVHQMQRTFSFWSDWNIGDQL